LITEFELVLIKREKSGDHESGGKIGKFRLSLDPDCFNAYRLSSSKERALLLRAIEETMDAHLL